MAVEFPENLLVYIYGEDRPLQILSDTGSMLERVITTNLSKKDVEALLGYYRDARTLAELSRLQKCTAAEVILRRATARTNLSQYLYITPAGVVGDNNAYPRPLLRVLYGRDVPELKEDIPALLSQAMLYSLTMDQMRILRKRYINGVPLERIARAECCTLSKVKFLEQAALQRLRAYLPYFEVGGPDIEMLQEEEYENVNY